MKIVVIADIHANIHSVRLFISYLKDVDYDEVFCLGDIIGYGDKPNEVIELLNSINAKAVMGNHEHLFLQGRMDEKYNFPYTRRVLSKESLNYLSQLPKEIFLESYDAVFSHGVPFTDFKYLYANSDFSVIDNIGQRKIFMGHTHYPMLITYFDKTIINPGSLGRPRDNVNRPSIVVCDLALEKYQFIRL